MLVQYLSYSSGITAALGLYISALVLRNNCISHSLAYIAEIIRAGINAVDRGEMEAARSLGSN